MKDTQWIEGMVYLWLRDGSFPLEPSTGEYARHHLRALLGGKTRRTLDPDLLAFVQHILAPLNIGREHLDGPAALGSQWLADLARQWYPEWDWFPVGPVSHYDSFIADCVFLKARQWLSTPYPTKRGAVLQLGQEGLHVLYTINEPARTALAYQVLTELLQHAMLVPEGAVYPCWMPMFEQDEKGNLSLWKPEQEGEGTPP